MDNKTVSDAIAVHGTNPQFLIEKILRTRIYESKYWKEQCFGLTESTIVEKAFNLTYIGGQYGTQKPTEFICLVLKLLQLQPSEDIVIKYITGLSEDDDKDDSNKYLRALGAFYLRLTGKPATIYKVLEPLLDDPRKLRKRTVNGFTLTYMDEFVDELLREERVCDVVLPRLTKRYVLEDAGELDPRRMNKDKLEMREELAMMKTDHGLEADPEAGLEIQEKIQKQITSHKIIETALTKPFPLKITNSSVEIQK
ncbi:Pre-mRNA-splicing factor 38A [Actinomortierella wolfii]|nr:Pre-mRNA-splicing factor 38A [Actinomortierella wolfii]